MTEAFVGLDLGTTSIKAIAFDAEDRELAAANRPTPTHQLDAGGAEYDAEELWQVATDVLSEVTSELADSGQHPVAIAIASMGEAGVLVDDEGLPLTQVIAWFDPRTEPQAQWWDENVGVARTQQIAGLTPKAVFGAAKMLWTRDNLPDVWASGSRWLNMADWVAFRLTGEMATDYSLASRTMLFDVAERTWSDELIGEAGLDRERLAPLVQSGTKIGHVTSTASAATGLAEGTVVGAGGQDHVCAAFALGVTEPGMVLDSIGTAEALLMVTEGFDASGRIAGAGINQGAHVVPGRTYAMTGFLGGGRIDQVRADLALEWDEFLANPDAEAVIAEVATNGQDRVDAMRSVAGVELRRQLVTGGGSRIDALIAKKRSLANHDIEVVAQMQATALGAAKLAQRAMEDA